MRVIPITVMMTWTGVWVMTMINVSSMAATLRRIESVLKSIEGTVSAKVSQ